jgi:hypothetical protein
MTCIIPQNPSSFIAKFARLVCQIKAAQTDVQSLISTTVDAFFVRHVTHISPFSIAKATEDILSQMLQHVKNRRKR